MEQRVRAVANGGHTKDTTSHEVIEFTPAFVLGKVHGGRSAGVSVGTLSIESQGGRKQRDNVARKSVPLPHGTGVVVIPGTKKRRDACHWIDTAHNLRWFMANKNPNTRCVFGECAPVRSSR